MKKYFYPLKLKDIIGLIVIIVIGFGWILVDQIVLKEAYLRFIAFSLLLSTLYYFQFLVNKPRSIFHYANSIAIVMVSFNVLVSVIMHLIIVNNFTLKSVMIWIIVGILPYVSGFVYKNAKKSK